VAELAAEHESAKYIYLPTHHTFQPIARKILGVFSLLSSSCTRGHEISSGSGEEGKTTCLTQRLYVALQLLNAAFLHDTFLIKDNPVKYPSQLYLNSFEPYTPVH